MVKELFRERRTWIFAGVAVFVMAGFLMFMASSANRMVTAVPVAPVIQLPAHRSMTNNTMPTISGTATPGEGDVVVRYGDGTLFCIATVAASGSWSCAPGASLVDDVYVVYASQAGSAETNGREFTIDTVSIAPTISAPPEGFETENKQPTISGAASEWGTTITIFIDGNAVGTTRPAGGAGWRWTFTPSAPLADGQHVITAIARDDAGNTSAVSAGRTFKVISVVPPVVPPVTPPVTPPATPSNPEGSSTNKQTSTISGTGTAGNTVTARDETGKVLCTATVQADGTWSCAATESATGELQATETDAEGNELPISAVLVEEEEEVKATDSKADNSDEVAPKAKSKMLGFVVALVAIGAIIAAAIGLILFRRKRKSESGKKNSLKSSGE